MKIKVKTTDLISMSKSLLTRRGLSIDYSNIVISHILEEELMGNSSHGFYRLPGIIRSLQTNPSRGFPIIKKITDYCALVNGANHLGLIVAHTACIESINIAKTNGLSLVGATKYVGTTGAMGYFTRLIANENLIGICFCNSEYAVAPWGGKDPILGTNPISFGIPTISKPIIVDFSTAARTYGDLMLDAKEKKKIPLNIVLDSEGKQSNDPNDANTGCQLPMAQHKGYGLGLAIEILAGSFIGSKVGRIASVGSDGIIFITFKPDLFVPISDFYSNNSKLLDEILNSAPAEGFDKIRIPGCSSYDLYIDNKGKDNIEVDDSVLNDIRLLAEN